mmetsp:Transcript_24592/g.53866  ORF Transcript_24592/g.53866 Transcript_24592/m.53866 type:complete len:574 (+) Transcript_24592:394-2115(+)|eukprot:CAMPEP_0168209220 /NCGR_PEP_ID=MMETSP0140_2-20121125/2488_1 /TAXON_ID=44445 /ORGANISM="Pseudo-nitzschia australis, Strain 10249 10 AB" /LENGTH=573 /DNA_ID=CAMNT_0008135675 /DNA_START=122 /DNA_END=1843 /DNA_ORIENTATION=+
MKAKTLGRVASGIMLSVSVVVAFVQHGATSFAVRKASDTVVGGRHSMTEIVAFAGSYTPLDDDLSSILQTAKSDFGGKVGSAASNIPTETVNEVVRATKDAAVSASKVTPIVEDGKARPLFNFVQASVTGENNPVAATSSWGTTKANSALLRDNILNMVGKDSLPSESINAPAVDLSHFDFQLYFDSLSPSGKGMAALAAVGTLLLLLGVTNKDYEKPVKKKQGKTTAIEPTSDATGGLTDELGTLQSRMKALEARGINLDSQLMEAKTKLTQKELDISKAKLQAAGNSLSLNREIDTLKQKLSENDGKVKTLDQELAGAREECMDLLKELDKAKEEQEKAHEVAAAKKAAEEKAQKVAAAKKAVEKARKEEELAHEEEKEKARKVAAAKKAVEKAKEEEKLAQAAIAAAKNTGPKMTVEKPKQEEKRPQASVAAPKKDAPKKTVEKIDPEENVRQAVVELKKAALKKAMEDMKQEERVRQASASKLDAPLINGDFKARAEMKSKAEAPKKATTKKATTNKGDLTTLSKSALARTTVKVFNEFLASKGIPTVDKNGKQLKKVDLIKAVNSIST